MSEICKRRSFANKERINPLCEVVAANGPSASRVPVQKLPGRWLRGQLAGADGEEILAVDVVAGDVGCEVREGHKAVEVAVTVIRLVCFCCHRSASAFIVRGVS